ncbi:hypothetical protein KKI93_22905 [Xenorhabdus bovienii]|uniref:hypothetical protein n=1 Tax=Xenorhabdus bovienii TaxID=40576 RepID=UPI0023B30520|nr:hypothetical protein [Xenorhabdus bovienii]MDE9545474.1 hypothetical protein [Xenorhabdus bovienii]MDE9552655.1 hypothetical protein [Xenorhabdus bovienii]MDE9566764.1 hypothetical protein [Xenorhabdus bovienii]
MHQINIEHFNIDDEDEFFKFDQIFFRDDYTRDIKRKGLCFGISFCLLSYLVFKEPSGILCPEKSFNQARIYMDMLKLSYASQGGMYQFVKKNQTYESEEDYLRSSKKIDINEANGYGMLSMVRIDGKGIKDINPKFHYKRHESIANHMGVIVWDSSKLFIFEPNCGGYLYYAKRGKFNQNMFPQLIDILLDDMYRRTDRNGGSRIRDIHQPNHRRHYLTGDLSCWFRPGAI